MKPIIFSTPMVQAILDGRKTQTRRVINPSRKQINFMGDMDIRSLVRSDESTEEWLQLRSENGSPVTCIKVPYQPGDILWVRETWQRLRIKKPHRAIPIDFNFIKYIYKADGEIANSDGTPFKWRPSIFMPREAARIFLRVKDVRVERLQDITEEDAIAEGIRIGIGGEPYFSCRDAFVALWNSINTKRGYGWDTNPWVWVISFERINSGGI